MSAIPNSTTVTKLRRESASILKSLPDEKYLLLIQNSVPKGALVDIEYLKMLQTAYEDYLDIITFDRSVSAPTITWQQHRKKSLASQ